MDIFPASFALINNVPETFGVRDLEFNPDYPPPDNGLI
jgi:hypothetical protein